MNVKCDMLGSIDGSALIDCINGIRVSVWHGRVLAGAYNYRQQVKVYTCYSTI